MASISIAGAGWAGMVHAMATVATGRANVRAVASRDPAHAGDTADLVGAEAVTYVELPVADETVVIATPPVHHHELGRRLIGRGVPVLIEKPLCATLDEADDLIATAAASGSVAGYAENLLFAPMVIEAQRRIAGLGQLRHLELRSHQLPPTWGHFIEPLTAGGVLFDLGAHPIALALALLDPVRPTGVSATLTSTRPDGADDEANVTLHYAGGPHVSIGCSWTATEISWGLQAAGDSGTVVAEFQPNLSLEHNGEPVDLPEPSADLAEPLLEQFGYIGQLNGLLDAVAGRGGRVCPLGFARQVLDVTCAAYASAALNGAPVSVPFEGPRDRSPLQLWRG